MWSVVLVIMNTTLLTKPIVECACDRPKTVTVFFFFKYFRKMISVRMHEFYNFFRNRYLHKCHTAMSHTFNRIDEHVELCENKQ